MLSKPLVLIGFPGIEYRQVGRDLAALTGLPFIDVDQWVEHQAGQSLWALVQSRGEDLLHQARARLLDKALNSRPCGIVVVGDGTALTEPARLEQVVEAAVVVYFKLSLAMAYWTLRRQLRERGLLAHPFLPHPLDSSEQLRPLFAACQMGCESAHMTIDMEHRDTDEAVRLMMEALPRLGASDPGAPAGR